MSLIISIGILSGPTAFPFLACLIAHSTSSLSIPGPSVQGKLGVFSFLLSSKIDKKSIDISFPDLLNFVFVSYLPVLIIPYCSWCFRFMITSEFSYFLVDITGVVLFIQLLKFFTLPWNDPFFSVKADRVRKGGPGIQEWHGVCVTITIYYNLVWTPVLTRFRGAGCVAVSSFAFAGSRRGRGRDAVEFSSDVCQVLLGGSEEHFIPFAWRATGVGWSIGRMRNRTRSVEAEYTQPRFRYSCGDEEPDGALVAEYSRRGRSTLRLVGASGRQCRR